MKNLHPINLFALVGFGFILGISGYAIKAQKDIDRMAAELYEQMNQASLDTAWDDIVNTLN